MGKEFYNANVQQLMKKHGINHISTYSIMQSSVVEPFNRTLKNDMWKLCTLNGNYKWIEVVSRLVAEYNAQKHQTIGMRHVDVIPAIPEIPLGYGVQRGKDCRCGEIQSRPFRTSEQVQDGLREGLHAELSLYCIYLKISRTTERFKIAKVQRTNPINYLLEYSRGKIITGGFYEDEVYRVADLYVYLVEKVSRRKGNQVYVKSYVNLAPDISRINF